MDVWITNYPSLEAIVQTSGTPHRSHNRFIHFLFNKQQSIRILMSTSHRVSQCTRTEISTDIIVPLRSVFFHLSHCSNIFGETRAIAALPGEAERKYLPTEGSDNKCLPPEEWLTSPISASAPTLGSPLGLCVGRGGRGRSGPGSEVWQATSYHTQGEVHDNLLGIPRCYCSNQYCSWHPKHTT